jgi:hypothetical protein
MATVVEGPAVAFALDFAMGKGYPAGRSFKGCGKTISEGWEKTIRREAGVSTPASIHLLQIECLHQRIT